MTQPTKRNLATFAIGMAIGTYIYRALIKGDPQQQAIIDAVAIGVIATVLRWLIDRVR